jgi:transcriptional regulator with XRE-family HTH domain
LQNNHRLLEKIANSETNKGRSRESMGRRSLSRRELTNLIGQPVRFNSFHNQGDYICELLGIEPEGERELDDKSFNVRIKILAIDSFPLPGKNIEDFWTTNLPLPYGYKMEVDRSFVERYRLPIDDYEISYRKTLLRLFNSLVNLYEKDEGSDLEDEEYRLQIKYKEDRQTERAIRALIYLHNKKFPNEPIKYDQLNTIGYRLKIARENQGYTYDNLYNMERISSHQIEKYENDLIDPSSDMLKDLSELYDVSIDWIIKGQSFKTNEEKREESLLIYWKNRAEKAEQKFNKLSNALDTIMELTRKS